MPGMTDEHVLEVYAQLKDKYDLALISVCIPGNGFWI